MTNQLTSPEFLRALEDQVLHDGVTRLAKDERRTGAAIIAHLIVLDERKVYVERGFSSLWKYCTEGLGFSAATAHRRKVVVGLARAFPEILHSKAGDVSVSTTAPLPNTSRRPSRVVSDLAYVEARGQFTFVAPDGTRCTERSLLQDEHHRPFALGGRSDADNISKLCLAHNALRARQVFGDVVIKAAIVRRQSNMDLHA